MVLKKSNHRLNIDFSKGAVDLNKHVFIDLRKQIRQEAEGICASQF
tara:strand:+ start:257 stop:394 length:138 start_codon:yes stop_codon:yes gene_type:complete